MATSGLSRSMPNDLFFQTCKRVGAAAIAFAALWAFALIMNNIVTRILGVTMLYYPVWPMPGNLICGIGLAASLLLAFISKRQGMKPDVLLDLGSVYPYSPHCWWGSSSSGEPHVTEPNPSWIIVGIVLYPSIVPNTPRKTLITGLLAASMGPLALWVTTLRGHEVHATLFNYLWAFLPNYVAAAIAVVPAKVIRGLGQQVAGLASWGATGSRKCWGRGEWARCIAPRIIRWPGRRR